MRRRTTPLRVILAVLAGAVSAPLFVLLIAFATDLNTWTTVPTAQSVRALPAAVLISVMFGAPVALVSIGLLFGPLWFAHHRSGGGLVTFLLTGAAAGMVMAVPLALLGSFGSLKGGLLILLNFTAAAVPTSSVLWAVAYGGQGHRKLQPVADIQA